MDAINIAGLACCFNTLSDCVASINHDWKKRWNESDPGFCFRGADDSNYDLNPSLLRPPYPATPESLATLENSLWVEFRLRSKPLLGRHINNSWEALLIMQQYGFPTRLLDWSRSLAVAAYFAIRNSDVNEDGVVWVMAARHLMQIRGATKAWRTIVGDPNLEALSLRQNKEKLEDFLHQTPIPLSPDQLVPRMVAQRGIYTLHSFQKDALESLAIEDAKNNGPGSFLHKIIIPSYAKESLRSELLVVAGITEETVFPDIEGFARDFVSEYKKKMGLV